MQQHLYSYQFTVFTPTYNRSKTLHRVYDSLCQQTFKDFEWLIVDDGSSDDTRHIVEHWQEISPFPIRYFYQENRGKHIAYNLAALQSEAEFIICLDSDDGCVPDALKRLNDRWYQIPIEDRSSYSGIDCHCLDIQGQSIGTPYPMQSDLGLISNYSEMRHYYRVQGEKWGFQRTSILREFLFPDFETIRMTHIPESIVWIPMTQKYPVLYVNEWLRIYHHDPETDQLSEANLMINNSIGIWLMNQTMLKLELDYLAPLSWIKLVINSHRAKFHIHRHQSENLKLTNVQTKSEIKRELHFYESPRNLSWLLKLLFLPLGYILYQADVVKYNKSLRRNRFSPIKFHPINHNLESESIFRD